MTTTVQQQQALSEGTGLPLVLRLRPVVDLSDDQLLALCEINDVVWIERNAKGELLLMSPAGFESSARNARITTQLGNWAEEDGTGVATGALGGFLLPNGAMRAPDGAWISHARLATISADDREKFLPACPDFVIELRSPSDNLRDLQAKLEEWIANGARLGWLLDPRPRHLYIYRPDAPVERHDNLDQNSADPVLPGFVLNLREIWGKPGHG